MNERLHLVTYYLNVLGSIAVVLIVLGLVILLFRSRK